MAWLGGGGGRNDNVVGDKRKRSYIKAEMVASSGEGGICPPHSVYSIYYLDQPIGFTDQFVTRQTYPWLIGGVSKRPAAHINNIRYQHTHVLLSMSTLTIQDPHYISSSRLLLITLGKNCI